MLMCVLPQVDHLIYSRHCDVMCDMQCRTLILLYFVTQALSLIQVIGSNASSNTEFCTLLIPNVDLM